VEITLTPIRRIRFKVFGTREAFAEGLSAFFLGALGVELADDPVELRELVTLFSLKLLDVGQRGAKTLNACLVFASFGVDKLLDFRDILLCLGSCFVDFTFDRVDKGV
jgi:hypothetical protein